MLGASLLYSSWIISGVALLQGEIRRHRRTGTGVVHLPRIDQRFENDGEDK